LSRAISGFTRPIFTQFSAYGRYLIADYRSDPLFPIARGTLPWQPILGQEHAKSPDSFSFVAWHFKTAYNIAILISIGWSLMISLHCM